MYDSSLPMPGGHAGPNPGLQKYELPNALTRRQRNILDKVGHRCAAVN